MIEFGVKRNAVGLSVYAGLWRSEKSFDNALIIITKFLSCGKDTITKDFLGISQRLCKPPN